MFDMCQHNAQFFIEYFEENLRSVFGKYGRVTVFVNVELRAKITSNKHQVTEKSKGLNNCFKRSTNY